MKQELSQVEKHRELDVYKRQIQWAGRSDSKLADFFSKPGLAMQKLTTKEPTADMAEVARCV